MTFTPAAAAKANRLSIPVKPSLPVPAGINWSTVPPPIRRLPMPRLRKRVMSELFAGLNRLPLTPALPEVSGPRSKLSPAKSAGTSGPGCWVSIVIVTGWVTRGAAPCAGEDIIFTSPRAGRKIGRSKTFQSPRGIHGWPTITATGEPSLTIESLVAAGSLPQHGRTLEVSGCDNNHDSNYHNHADNDPHDCQCLPHARVSAP